MNIFILLRSALTDEDPPLPCPGRTYSQN